MKAAWRVALPGTCALFVGVGIGRFAYSPFIPALVEAGWASPAGAAYLGAGNLAAYVLGALATPRLPPSDAVLRWAMVLTAMGFLASAADLGFAWLLAWRVLLGFTGGLLMGLAGPRLLAATAPERRGAVTGLVYAGVGLGIVGSGLLVPTLVAWSLPAAWLGIGAVALVAALVGSRGWPPPAAALAPVAAAAPDPAVVRLGLAYALFGFAGVPHSLFFVDYAARELGLGLAAAGPLWVAVGVGAVVGPVAAGRVADRTGFRRATVAGFLVLTLSAVLAAVTASWTTLALSALLVGACMPGIAGLVGGRLVELAGIVRQRALWPPLVVAFAVGQGAGGYLFAWIFAETGSHVPSFVAAAVMAFAGAVLTAAPSGPAGGTPAPEGRRPSGWGA